MRFWCLESISSRSNPSTKARHVGSLRAASADGIDPVGDMLQPLPLEMLDDARVHEIAHGAPPSTTAA